MRWILIEFQSVLILVILILLKRKEFLNPTKDSKGTREKYLVDLRKKKKQDIFRAKRAIRILEKNDEEAQKDLRVTDTGIVQSDGVLSDTMQEYSTILEKMCPSLFQDTDSLGGKLQIVKEALEADDLEPKVYIALCTYIRILCCIGDLIHIEDVINAELFPLIMKMGSAESVTELMIEITWILVNITSSENKEIYEYILRPEFGLISYCKTMLRNSEEKVVTNTLWILANISQEGAPYDEILDTDVIDVIQEILNSAKVTLNLLRVIAHCLSNLAKCPKRNLEFLHILIENSATILYIQDEEAQFD